MPVVPGGAWWCLVVPVVRGEEERWVRCPLRVLRAASLNSGVVKKEQRGAGARAVC